MRTLLTVICLFHLGSIYSQVPPKPPNPGDDHGDLNCIYRKKYSAKQRLAFYPFNLSSIVRIVSFRYNKDNLAIKKDTVLLDSIIEDVLLDSAQINSLTDILYNNFYKRRANFLVESQCFWPRHAILFYDRQGKMFESVLICFQCGRYSKSSEKVDLGDECDQKIDKLQTFFKKIGIKFGIGDEPFFYPGEKYKDEGIVSEIGNK